jgi:hypothetical protein
MGTNYYAELPQCAHPCEHCNFDDRLHIGKSSGGWKFGFHGIPERGLTSWAAWQDFLADHIIYDEYGQMIQLGEFATIVTDRNVGRGMARPICRVDPTPAEIVAGFGGNYFEHGDYHDVEGYDFYDGEFS